MIKTSMRALVVLYPSNEPINDSFKKNLAIAISSQLKLNGDEIEMYELSGKDLAAGVYVGAVNNTIKHNDNVEEALKTAVNVIKDVRIRCANTHTFVITIVSILNSNNAEESDLLRNAIKTIVLYPDSKVITSKELGLTKSEYEVLKTLYIKNLV